MRGKSITSYDVAKAAKVSQSAVSRAFSPAAPIAKKTQAHILQVAAELGYQPNAIARSMSTARNDTHKNPAWSASLSPDLKIRFSPIPSRDSAGAYRPRDGRC